MLTKISFLIIAAAFSCGICSGQKAYDYRLIFDKRKTNAYCINIKCRFSLDFERRDSVIMSFGGNLEDLSINTLKICSKTPYRLRPEEKTITFYRTGNVPVQIKMSYSYINLMSAMIYGESDIEIWEMTHIGSGEYYYPVIYGSEYNADIRFLCPNSLEIIASCRGSQHRRIRTRQCAPINFACFPKKNYCHRVISSNYPIDVYEISSNDTPEERYAELSMLVKESIGYFQTIYGESYVNPTFGVYSYPVFIFHEGEDTFNRYNMGFISASQKKFSSFPDIYPLVHEIGHRWIGEYSLMAEPEQQGSAFIIESINEFMTLMFIYDKIGEKEYRQRIEKYLIEYSKITGTAKDKPVMELTKNNNVEIVYRKGPVILDIIAHEIGYENMKDIISDFYNRYKGVRNITVADFVYILNERFPDAAKKLQNMLYSTSLPNISNGGNTGQQVGYNPYISN